MKKFMVNGRMKNILSATLVCIMAVAAINAKGHAAQEGENLAEKENTTIQVFGRFQAKPEGRSPFRAALINGRKETPKEPGNLEMRLFDDSQDPNLFFGYLHFVDFAAVGYHRAQPYEVKIAELAATELVEPPTAYVLGPAVAGEVKTEHGRSVAPEEFFAVSLFELKPGQRDCVIAQYEKLIPQVRAQAGSISYNVYPVVDNPDQLIVIEWWSSPEAARQFTTTDPLSKETGELLAASLDRPIPEYLHELREVNP